MKLEEIVSKFDITTIMQGFTSQAVAETGVPYIGKVMLILYKRNETQSIITEMRSIHDVMLNGIMPDHKGIATEWDFFINIFIPKQTIIMLLDPLEQETILLDIELSYNDEGLIQVGIILP